MDPYYQGKQACNAGEQEYANPYVAGTTDALNWEFGYRIQHLLNLLDHKERNYVDDGKKKPSKKFKPLVKKKAIAG